MSKLRDAVNKLTRGPIVTQKTGLTLNQIVLAYAERAYQEICTNQARAKQFSNGLSDEDGADLVANHFLLMLGELKGALLNEVDKAPMPDFIVRRFSVPESEPAKPEQIPGIEPEEQVVVEATITPSAAIQVGPDRIVKRLDDKDFSGHHLIAILDADDPAVQAIIDLLSQ